MCLDDVIIKAIKYVLIWKVNALSYLYKKTKFV